jgi:hypothetical protein
VLGGWAGVARSKRWHRLRQEKNSIRFSVARIGQCFGGARIAGSPAGQGSHVVIWPRSPNQHTTAVRSRLFRRAARPADRSSKITKLHGICSLQHDHERALPGRNTITWNLPALRGRASPACARTARAPAPLVPSVVISSVNPRQQHQELADPKMSAADGGLLRELARAHHRGESRSGQSARCLVLPRSA